MSTTLSTHTVPSLEMSPFDSEYGAEPVKFTAADSEFFDQRESVIEKGINTFVKVSHALEEIRDYKGGLLYKEVFGTFQEYCRQRWTLSAAQVYRKITAAKTIKALSPRGDISQDVLDSLSEKQCREMNRLPDDDGKAALLKEAVAANNGKVPSSTKLKAMVDQRLSASDHSESGTGCTSPIADNGPASGGSSEAPRVLVPREAVKLALRKLPRIEPADRQMIEDCVAKVATVLNHIAGVDPTEQAKAALRRALEVVQKLLSPARSD